MKKLLPNAKITKCKNKTAIALGLLGLKIAKKEMESNERPA